MSRVAVIGGGIVGASVAFHLAEAGVETVLVDNAVPGRATSAGAGIVAPGTSMRNTPGFEQFGKPAVRYYPQLVEKLIALGVNDAGYEVCGKLVVADTEEKAERLPGNTEIFRQRYRDGMPNMGEIEEITPAQARELLPTLGEMLGAIYVPEAARVNGAKMRAAMTTGAERLGARVIVGDATLIMDGEKVAAVAVDDETIAVDSVVLAAGAWINQLMAPMNYSLPIAPQKGQILHIEMPDQDTTNWPILDWNSSQYQLCFGPNRVVCGATREFNSGYDLRVTPAGMKHILDEQLRLCPGLANGTIAEVRVGLRPYSADERPFIGHVPGHDNVVVCDGHGPSGLMMGPFSGLLGAELARGVAPSIDLSLYALDREIVEATH